MGDEPKWLLKEGGGCIFESCDISLENTPTSHAVSLVLVICTCSDSALPLLSCACFTDNSKWCLPSFVSPSSCTVLLLRCFLLNILHALLHKWVGVLSRVKHPLQQLHSKKGGGRIFEGGLIFGRLRYMTVYYIG